MRMVAVGYGMTGNKEIERGEKTWGRIGLSLLQNERTNIHVSDTKVRIWLW
jgi:hypothetical protein